MTGANAGRAVNGRFELLEPLGSGGMGTVWRALDTALHREVALKEVRPRDPRLAAEGSDAARRLRERVLREAQALARLSHRHVVTVHHIVDDEGPYPWIVMELLTGGLQTRVAQGPLPALEAAEIGRQVLSGLRAAHAAGIQHRDVKPANVLERADGDAVLTDFGIAALAGSDPLTATGELVGSPEYMAPERIRGTDDEPASDLWSLGMTLYVCTEGHSPLRRGTTLATLAAVLDEPVPPPVRSGALAPVLRALLVRDPTARPDAGTLEELLADVAAGRTMDSQPPGPSPQPLPAPVQPPAPPSAAPGPDAGTRPTHTARRVPSHLVVGVSVLVAVLLGTTGYVLFGNDGNGAERGGRSGQTVTDSPRAAESSQGKESPGRDPSDTDPSPSGESSGNSRPTGDASADGRGAEHTDAWIAQLGSVPKAQGTDERRRYGAALRAKVSGVRWLDSDDFASLRPGYWVFYRPGPDAAGTESFASGQATADWCASQGRTSANACLGRYLSDARADRGYLCSAEQGGGTGRCTRPD